MLLLLLSPFLALFADYLRRRFSVSIFLTTAFILLTTLPSLLVWFSGYSYSSTLGKYGSMTFFIAGALIGFYAYDNNETRNKAESSIVILMIIGVFLLIFSFKSIFSQHTDNVFNQTVIQNYKAEHSQDFDLVLHGQQRVKIKKTKLNGLIENTIFNETLPNPDTIPNCTLYLKDGDKNLSYQYCKNILKVEE